MKLRGSIEAQRAPPRDRYGLPETTQHDIGFYATSRSPAAPLPKSTSLPELSRTSVDWDDVLAQTEASVEKKLRESARYLNTGRSGGNWYRPVGSTEATKFSTDFMRSTSGVPLYKYKLRPV